MPKQKKTEEYKAWRKRKKELYEEWRRTDHVLACHAFDFFKKWEWGEVPILLRNAIDNTQRNGFDLNELGAPPTKYQKDTKDA